MTKALTSSPLSSEQLELFVVNGMALESFRNGDCSADVVQALDVTALETASSAFPPVLSESTKEDTDVRTVLAHYSRRLDRRLLHPMLRATTREAAMGVMKSEWAWYVRTSGTMSDLYREWTDAEARLRAAAVAQTQITKGARLIGEDGDGELAFLLSTFQAAAEVASVIVGEPAAADVPRDQTLRALFGAACHFYSLGLILLRAATYVTGRGEAGVPVALELVRIGAVHGYAHVREAWDLRRTTESEDWSNVTFDHRLALG